MRRLLITGLAMLVSVFAQAVTPPSEDAIRQARDLFLDIPRPISYESEVHGTFVSGRDTDIRLMGAANTYANSQGITNLAYALWDYMDGDTYDAEAVIVLMGHLKASATGLPALTYRDAAHPGNWPKYRKNWVSFCRNRVRFALGKGVVDGWYPHDVLFDEESALRGKTNEVLRAQYVEAMREALRKPDLASKNPLEVKNIFHLLSVLNAKEAAPEAIGYFFFSWKQGGDYRLSADSLHVRSDQVEDAVIDGLGRECPAPFFLARRVGEDSIPLVLDRYSKTSAAERAVEDGGGCAPVFVLHYFVCLGYSRAQAVEAIEECVRKKEDDLAKEQRAVMNSLLDVVRTGKYQADRRYFNDFRGWSLPPATPIDPAGKGERGVSP